MKRVIIIRHGQTVLNRKKALQGRSDLPLNETGTAEAMQAKQLLDRQGIVFDRVYSSPLARAVETARIASGSDDIRTDERLIEMDYGPYEGLDLTAPPPEIIRFFRDFVNEPAPPGMEQLSSVTARMGSFLEDLKNTADETILISTHAIALKGALEYLDPESCGKWWSRHIRNCDMFLTQLRDGAWSVPERFPDTDTDR